MGCIIGGGDAGSMAALRVRRLERSARIHIFSERAELGCPPCERPLMPNAAIGKWEDSYRGLRTTRFYNKGNVNLHFHTEVIDIL